MTVAELALASIVLSVLVSGCGWGIVGLVERRVLDARFRERAWAFVLYASVVPPVLIGLALLGPAPTVLTGALVETSSSLLTTWSDDAVFRIDRNGLALSLVFVGALATILRAVLLSARIGALSSLVSRTVPAGPGLNVLVDRLARDLCVPSPQVRLGQGGTGAVLTGFLRPLLILPPEFASQTDDGATQAVCAHELAHLKRGDHRALWVEELLLTLLAVNPVLRLIRNRRAAAREEACDGLALARTDPDGRRRYARTLIDAYRNAPSRSPRPALAFISSRRNFAMNRLNAVLNPTAPAGRRTRSLTLVAGIAMTALAATASLAIAAQRQAVSVYPEALVKSAAPVPATFTRAVPVASAGTPKVAAAAIPVPSAQPPVAPKLSLPAEPQTEGVVTNPSWAQMPAPQYPAEAAAAGVSQASVTLSCTVATAGSLSDCSIVSEDPVGVGFGAAAIEAARTARLFPKETVTSPTVRFTIRFRLS